MIGKGTDRFILAQGDFKNTYIINVFTGEIVVKQKQSLMEYYDTFVEGKAIPLYNYQNEINFFDVHNA